MSTVGDLNNLLTKNITKYPVLTTFKILKIIKFYISNFLKKNFFAALKIFFKKIGDLNFLFLEILTIVRKGYSITVFVTRLFKYLTLLKPALYIVVRFSQKNFPNFKKIFS